MAENEQGGRTPPFGNFSSNENTKLSKFIKSRRAAQLAAHKKRLDRTMKRNKGNKANNTIQGRHRTWKERSRKQRNKEKKGLSEKDKLRQLIFTIQFKPEEEIREIAKRYYMEKTKGVTVMTSRKRQELLESLVLIASIIASFEKISKEDKELYGENPTDELDKHDIEAGEHNIHVAKIVREEAEKAILGFVEDSAIQADVEKKAAEAKMKTRKALETVASIATTSSQAVGAGAGTTVPAAKAVAAAKAAADAAAEADALDSLLEKIQGMKI